MTTFEEFTRRRYASLLKQQAELQAQLRIVEKEIDDIERASRASRLTLTGSVQNALSAAQESPKRSQMTMKEAAIAILEKHPTGLPATDILSQMNKMLQSDYVRSSLSPQLSRLKRDGLVYDIGGIWKLNNN